jgi:hypothetical protein
MELSAKKNSNAVKEMTKHAKIIDEGGERGEEGEEFFVDI